MSSCVPLGTSPLQPFSPDPDPSSHEKDVQTCCPTVYVAPFPGDEKVIAGGVVSTTEYVTVCCVMLNCLSTAVTQKVYEPR